MVDQINDNQILDVKPNLVKQINEVDLNLNLYNQDKNFIIDKFEGPLDLLLFLIRKNRLDILEISLAKIADQFVDYVINTDFKNNLDLASEYMVISSQLVDIKAKYLLKSRFFNFEIPLMETSENILDQLVEYNKYKLAASRFLSAFENSFFIVKEVNDFDDFVLTNQIKNITLEANVKDEIFLTMKTLLENFKPRVSTSRSFALKHISIEQRTNEVLKLIADSWLPFSKLFTANQLTNEYLAITFLVLLELTSKRIIDIKQDKNFLEIYVRRNNGN